MYVIGQRWISEAETDLGLGVIQAVDFRMITVLFPAIDDVRVYSKESAPLARVIFKVGDKVPLEDESLINITEVTEIDGLVFYHDNGRSVAEMHLSGHIRLNQPIERLFSRQIDKNNLFELRQLALNTLSTIRQRPFYGLLGARTSLLPHQLYIAQQTTQDSLPRVLLADEVGLGKTIEAGLILHRLLLQQRIRRVLVLVPDHLVHQWLVEMVRRFNLRFSIIDTLAAEDATTLSNDQLFICPMSLATEPELAGALIGESWDMLVVDEAHHLTQNDTSEADADRSEQDNAQHNNQSYELVDTLAQQTDGLLLLTATPEQLGIEGHYARLRLLDPARYPSCEQFLHEQSQYQPIADLASALAEHIANDGTTQPDVLFNALSDEQQTRLQTHLPQWQSLLKEQRLLDTLIDRFGPGRALYRNTRHGIQGFPKRDVHVTTLLLPERYQLDSDNIALALHPEHGHSYWCDDDPRVDWLLTLLATTGKDKIVLICHHAQTVLDLEKHLWEAFGMTAAVFHEHMDLVERDRAAAFFADQEQGARILLCSEIGSEGRNFQFARHLVLFDLPFNCDLIEQRIGRLDRIGQAHDIQLHLPVFEHHPSQRWADVLEHTLDALSHPNPAAQNLLEAHKDTLVQHLQHANADLSALQQEREALEQALVSGRDRLLELHSCHPTTAPALAFEMNDVHEEDEHKLAHFLDVFADAFGLDIHDLGSDCLSIAPGEHMLFPDMPHLPDDGFMATTRREVALARDDVQFLSWEHPFIDQALELITTHPSGNVAVAYTEHHSARTGDCFLQLQFVAQCSAPKALQVERFLPPAAMHLTMTPDGDLNLNQPESVGAVQTLKRSTARGLIDQKADSLRPLLEKLQRMGGAQLDKMVASAEKKAKQHYQDAIARLDALAQHNPNIPDSLSAQVANERDDVLNAIGQAHLTLDSVRVVFCN